jgi:hypothetical protein
VRKALEGPGRKRVEDRERKDHRRNHGDPVWRTIWH